MTKTYAILCSPVPGHLNPMCSLGNELKNRGHQVIVYNIADCKKNIERYSLEHRIIGSDLFPIDSLNKKWSKISKSSGLKAYFETLAVHKEISHIMCRDIPGLAKEDKVDLLIIDQIQFQGKFIAQFCQIPFVTVACAIHLNRDSNPKYPPPITSWLPQEMTLLKQLYAKFLYILGDIFKNPSLIVANKWARKNSMKIYKSLDDTFSDKLQIIASLDSFDFQRIDKINNAHFVGDLVSDLRQGEVNFPWGKINNKKIVYAALGTIHTGIVEYYQIIDDAFAHFPDLQLVLSLGNNKSSIDHSIFKNAIVVSYAPQVDLIKKSYFVINHAGTNAVTECLKFGVPMICIPIANDQPAVAARVVHSGVGLRISPSKLTVEKLVESIKKIIAQEATYKNNTLRFANEIHQAGGVKRAADLIEAL